MKRHILIVWMTLILPYTAVYGQDRLWQQQFLMLDASREDPAYPQYVSSQLKALLDTGEYQYVCVDQSAVEWMFVDQYVKGNPRLAHLLDYYAHFWCPAHVNCTDDSSSNNYNAVMVSVLSLLREYNQNSPKSVSVLGLDFQPNLEEKGAHATWLVFPVNRRIAAFNEVTLTDSLLALTDKWWVSQSVAANTLRMIDACKDKLTSTLGREYYTLWQRFFLRYAEYQSSHRKLSPEERQKQLHGDYSYIDKELPGGKIIIGYDWLIHSLLHKNIAQ